MGRFVDTMDCRFHDDLVRIVLAVAILASGCSASGPGSEADDGGWDASNTFDAGSPDSGHDAGDPVRSDAGDARVAPDASCSGPNPSTVSESDHCWPGVPGWCCGDTVSFMVCADGEWKCEEGRIPLSQCGMHCENAPNRG